MDYLYDGSFNGLLTCIYFNYYKHQATGIYEKTHYQYTVINSYSFVESNDELANRVYQSIEQKISPRALDYVYYSYLSNNENKGNLILDFLKIGYKLGYNTLDYYAHEKINPIHQIYKKVGAERHRMFGMMRFADVQGILYAQFSCECSDYREALCSVFSRSQYNGFAC